MREQPRMRHGLHQMTTLILAHKDDIAILEPSASVVRCALVNKLYYTDVSCEWVSCLHHRRFPPGNRNHHHLSDDVGYHELQLVCHCAVCHCEVEDEDAAGGFPRGSL